MEKVANVGDFFECKLCDYVTSKKYNYDKHVFTAKHLKIANGDVGDKKVAKKYKCTNCEKSYISHNGIWLHKKKCIPSQHQPHHVSSTERKSDTAAVDTTLILSLIQQNQDFQKQMFEMMKENMLTITNCNNTTTNNNNKFNLNVFLNETCKDAMNIKDFIASLQLQLKDLEYTGEKGYAAGVSKIFLRELNQLDVCKRPIHCSDLKREVLHIKEDNKWERERIYFIKAIKEITRKNVYLLQEWREAHPGCDKYHHQLNDQYLKMTGEALGPIDDNEEQRCFNKIISSIAKATMIQKE